MKNCIKKNKKIVCLGGGNALTKAVLPDLISNSIEVVFVSSMFDSGGSSGELRKEFDILPPGDIRRHLLALSKAPEWKKDLFNFRFGGKTFKGGHKGHNLGNVFIASLERTFDNYGKVLEVLHDFLEIKGKCLPVTIEKSNVCAVLENGEKIIGEDEIDVPKKHNHNLKIKKVFVEPKVKAFPPVLKEIKEADLIIIGPGDLYSSLIPCLLADGIKESILESKARKVFICNLMTKKGETSGFSVLDFTKEIENYLSLAVDYVIFNNYFPNSKNINYYKENHSELIDAVRFDEDLPGNKFIGKNLLINDKIIEHSFQKVNEILKSLI
jgi:uncharacterized cofD-like protein